MNFRLIVTHRNTDGKVYQQAYNFDNLTVAIHRATSERGKPSVRSVELYTLVEAWSKINERD